MTSLDRIVLFVFGSPGSGKTTVVRRISAEIGAETVHSSRILREAQTNPAIDIGIRSQIKQNMLTSTPMPAEIYVTVAAKALKQRPTTNLLAFDGFPRTLAQTKAIPGLLQEAGYGQHTVVGIQLVVDEATAISRVKSRVFCSTCGSEGNAACCTMPTKTPRPDDASAEFIRRYRSEDQEASKIATYFNSLWRFTKVHDAEAAIRFLCDM
ncbi:nucleoside monophosphate kinase [Catellatospora paridis]|uniref:nucleoside monophosphate kinase n=1 Tax=Catellatospora paridis TaxID=1617086 RepID=UPI0012D484C3|nr:nucleoside monophosphate kinase [Catellatospora paridis]